VRKIFLISFLIISTSTIFAQDIRIICPYVGPITNVYKDDGRKLDLKDNSLMKGLFFQVVRPDVYQWNAFIYQSSNINYSTIWGGHFIFDYYIPSGEQNKFVVGGGVEYIHINMDADSSIYPLKNMKLLNDVYIPYARFGYRLQMNSGLAKLAILPWAGVEYEGVSGRVSFSIKPSRFAPLVPVFQRFDGGNTFGMLGLNLNAHIYHMFEVELKYYGSFDNKNYYSTANAMINLFLSRSFGISYRAKYMEIGNGSDLYHIVGLAFVF
jgi:hypothetical protein